MPLGGGALGTKPAFSFLPWALPRPAVSGTPAPTSISAAEEEPATWGEIGLPGVKVAASFLDTLVLQPYFPPCPWPWDLQALYGSVRDLTTSPSPCKAARQFEIFQQEAKSVLKTTTSPWTETAWRGSGGKAVIGRFLFLKNFSEYWEESIVSRG